MPIVSSGMSHVLNLGWYSTHSICRSTFVRQPLDNCFAPPPPQVQHQFTNQEDKENTSGGRRSESDWFYPKEQPLLPPEKLWCVGRLKPKVDNDPTFACDSVSTPPHRCFRAISNISNRSSWWRRMGIEKHHHIPFFFKRECWQKCYHLNSASAPRKEGTLLILCRWTKKLIFRKVTVQGSNSWTLNSYNNVPPLLWDSVKSDTEVPNMDWKLLGYRWLPLITSSI